MFYKLEEYEILLWNFIEYDRTEQRKWLKSLELKKLCDNIWNSPGDFRPWLALMYSDVVSIRNSSD